MIFFLNLMKTINPEIQEPPRTLSKRNTEVKPIWLNQNGSIKENSWLLSSRQKEHESRQKSRISTKNEEHGNEKCVSKNKIFFFFKLLEKNNRLLKAKVMTKYCGVYNKCWVKCKLNRKSGSIQVPSVSARQTAVKLGTTIAQYLDWTS